MHVTSSLLGYLIDLLHSIANFIDHSLNQLLVLNVFTPKFPFSNSSVKKSLMINFSIFYLIHCKFCSSECVYYTVISWALSIIITQLKPRRKLPNKSSFKLILAGFYWRKKINCNFNFKNLGNANEIGATFKVKAHHSTPFSLSVIFEAQVAVWLHRGFASIPHWLMALLAWLMTMGLQPNLACRHSK